MRRGRDPSRTPSRPRRPVWDNPRGQIPGTGIRSDAENLYSGNLRGGSTQGVSGNSSGGLAVLVSARSLEGDGLHHLIVSLSALRVGSGMWDIPSMSPSSIGHGRA